MTNRGVTLFEIMIGLILIVFFLGNVFLYMVSNKRGISVNKEFIIATAAADELTEQLLSIPFPDLPGSFSAELVTDKAGIGNSSWTFMIAGDSSLSRSVEISVGEKAGRIVYKMILVKVSWKSENGADRSQTLTSVYSNENVK